MEVLFFNKINILNGSWESNYDSTKKWCCQICIKFDLVHHRAVIFIDVIPKNSWIYIYKKKHELCLVWIRNQTVFLSL